MGDFKVPSVMYYDSMGNFKAAGFEALTEEVAEKAITEGWVKLEWSAINDLRGRLFIHAFI